MEPLPQLKHNKNIKEYTYPNVLAIAGFDGSGGAGIQGDIKTISALGCYATSVLTALPVQNTMGVQSVYPIPNKVVEAQLESILEDIVPDAIKIGMIASSELVIIIASILRQYPEIPVVYDPVIASGSGHPLMEATTIQTIVRELFPLISILTPNLDEAQVLTQMPVRTIEDMYVAGTKLKTTSGCKSILLKGGHLQTDALTSLYFSEDGTIETFESPKYESNNTHGTGCTLSSAIASYIAQGKSFKEAVTLAQQYVQNAIYHGIDVKTGKGNGPLNHFFEPLKMIKK